MYKWLEFSLCQLKFFEVVGIRKNYICFFFLQTSKVASSKKQLDRRFGVVAFIILFGEQWNKETLQPVQILNRIFLHLHLDEASAVMFLSSTNVRIKENFFLLSPPVSKQL